MDKLGFDLDDGTVAPTEKQANPQVRKRDVAVYVTPAIARWNKERVLMRCAPFFFLFVCTQEARKESIKRCIQSLIHACQCRDANCRNASCHRMKRVVQHTKACKMKVNGHCPICKQLIALCFYHAKHCQVSVLKNGWRGWGGSGLFGQFASVYYMRIIWCAYRTRSAPYLYARV